MSLEKSQPHYHENKYFQVLIFVPCRTAPTAPTAPRQWWELCIYESFPFL